MRAPGDLVKPPALQMKDCVAIISPSAAALARFPQRAARAITALRNFGLEPVVAPNAGARLGERAGTPRQRAEDIAWAFENPKIAGIICAIGGLNTNEILPYVDFDLIRRNPKVFVGFSDVTALLIAIYCQAGMVTFHGPALLPQWGEYPAPLEETCRAFKQICFGIASHQVLPEFSTWTDEYLEWSESDLNGRCLHKGAGWRWLKAGRGHGRLFGGNVDTLNVLCGTPYLDLPKEDAIIFLEATILSEGSFRRALAQLLQAGFFASCRGILFAKYNPENRSPEHRPNPNPYLLDEALMESLGHLDVPIVTGLDFGHTDPMLTLPVGVPAMISSEDRSIHILENAVHSPAPDICSRRSERIR
jgi:muramoyltetrapeptide carboxypeptidase LdcA involved in peptidoglycan recycling